METQENSKGRGLYATKEYQPWDLINTETAVFANSAVCNKEYIEIAKKTKDQHVEGSFLNRMLTFIARAPDEKVRNQPPQLKFALVYLLNGGKVEKISHLAQTVKLSVTDNQILKAAKTFKLSKNDIKLVAQVFKANAFSVPGLFLTEVGMALFDTGSMLNHSCNPNAFILITYDKMLIYARKPILSGEEITISYKPLCIPNVASLLEFKCQCGSCNPDLTILKETYDQFSQIQVVHERIDYMLDRCKLATTEHVELLIQSYYEIWAVNKTYKEKDFYKILRKFSNHPEPSSTWIEAQLLALVLSSRLGLADDQKIILQKLDPFIKNKDIIENIVVTTTLIPHMYHTNLIDLLTKLGYTP